MTDSLDFSGPDWGYLGGRLWYRLVKHCRRTARAIARPGRLRRQDPSGLLDWCQEQIGLLSPHPRYVQYRDHERYPWEVIPRWMAEDRGRRIMRVLDVGCAFGTLALYARRLYGAEVFCIDKSDSVLSPALRETHDLMFEVCNVELDPLPWEGTFDVVIFTEVLEHLNFSPLPTLIKLRRALSPSGVLYLATPDPVEWGRITRFYRSLDAMPQPARVPPIKTDHVYHYTRRELGRLFDAAGLLVLREGLCIGVSNRHQAFALVARME